MDENLAFDIIKASELYKLIDYNSIIETVAYIKKNNIALKSIKKFAVFINNEGYPPKDFLRKLAYLKRLKIDESSFYGGVANKPFEKLGYPVFLKTETPLFDGAKISPQIRKYQDAIENTKWLKEYELYKFNFAKWIASNIDFENDSSASIVEKIAESQEQKFTLNSNEKGINFIKSIIRYQDEYLTINDVAKIKKIISSSKIPNKEDLKLSFNSYPKTSVFLSLFKPSSYSFYDKESMTAFSILSTTKKPPKTGFKAFQFYQIVYSNVKKFLKESHLDTQVFETLLQTNALSELHWNFITQDFLLYIAREIMQGADTIDVKFDFAKYLLHNKPPSYEQYLGNTIERIIGKLTEIDVFFENKLFIIKNKNYQSTIELIEDQLSEKKENAKFNNYSKDKGNDIPQAIIGKNNYFKFLKAFFSNKDSFQAVLNKLSVVEQNTYFSFLREIINTLGIKPNDNRIVFSVRNYQLNFIVGQKYCWNIYTSSNKGKYGVISVEKLNENSSYFTNENKAHFYTEFNDDTLLSQNNKDLIIKSIQKILSKTNKSGFLKYNNSDFEQYTFNIMTKKAQALNQILYGPPGTGKTYHTINKAIAIINPNFDLSQERKIIKDEYNRLVKQGQIVFSTFHQSMSYEDFVEGIKPKTNEEQNVYYEVEDGIFKQICEKAQIKESGNFKESYFKMLSDFNDSEKEFIDLKTPNGNFFSVNVNSNNNLKLYTTERRNPQGTLTKERLERYYLGNKTVFQGWEGYAKGVIKYLENEFVLKKSAIEGSKKFVLIIDEINRGNVSAIFGELITLLEEDKRIGNGEALKVNLPYSKESFGVPKNLYIIGTMNTADRSVEALDTALRRRFDFSEMMPKYNLKELQTPLDVDLNKILKIINDRIEILLDRSHQIGHSYFINIDNKEALLNAFENKIIPLLQEYFYNDYDKIGLVLGDKFIVKNKNKNSSLFANYQLVNKIDYLQDSFAWVKLNSSTIIDAVNSIDGMYNEND